MRLFLLYFAVIAAAQPAPLAFTHVTVIDATGRPHIKAIGETGRLRMPPGARIVEARGKFLIPGLWDMHVHFRGGAELIPDNESGLRLFVADGVTSVREIGGDIAATVFP